MALGAGRAASEGGACRGDFPWVELRSRCAGNGAAGRGWPGTWVGLGRPSVYPAGSLISGLSSVKWALLGGGELLGRYPRDGSEHACVRVFQ